MDLLLVMLIICIITCGTLIIEKEVKRNKFSKQYGIDKLPTSIKIKRRKKAGHNYYKLKYPYWSFSKKDGTADLRVKDNNIVWPKSTLYIDNLSLVTKRPYDLLDVVKKLRLQNIEIDLCKEEKEKYVELAKRKKAFAHNTDIQRIIDHYSENPTEFESLCAELFNNMGYISKLTPKTNDGGYDILLSKNDERIVVECKCYAVTNKVGRPAIQKLVGANNIVLANRMIFVTTSDFSKAAISYAEEVGVELINGYKLMQLLSEYCFFEQKSVEISMLECQLEISDLRLYVPTDIYEDFFV